MKLKLELCGELKSNNELMRMHWTKRRKLIEVWAWMVSVQLNHTGQAYIGNTSKFKCPVRVKVTVFRPRGRPMDDSNLIAGADKLIIDNLVRQRILVDDSDEYLTWEKPVQKTGKAKAIVEIEEGK